MGIALLTKEVSGKRTSALDSKAQEVIKSTMSVKKFLTS
jgi:hypothetical protein